MGSGRRDNVVHGVRIVDLMMGLAAWLSRRAFATLWVGLFALAASLRFPSLDSDWKRVGQRPRLARHRPRRLALSGKLGTPASDGSGLRRAGDPADGSARLRGPSVLTLATLALVVVAGFESSTWIGGVAFAVAAPTAALVLLTRLEPKRRTPFLITCLSAAVLAAVFAAPFLHDQVVATAQRGGEFPVGIDPYEVLGPWFPEHLRRILDLPAFWLVLLFIEFPAILITGAIGLAGPLVSEPETARKRVTAALAALVAVSLIVTWLLTSRLGDHNDLAWRAVLPAVLALMVAASVGLTRWISQRAHGAAFAAIAALILALPEESTLRSATRPDMRRGRRRRSHMRQHCGPPYARTRPPMNASPTTRCTWPTRRHGPSIFPGRC